MIDEQLEKYLPKGGKLNTAMRYSVLAKGKRFRSKLCLAVAKALGKEPKRVLPIACAIELLHTFTLIHDDLPAMDNSDLRRGKSTNHIKFDEATAILAGDALNTLAFKILAQANCKNIVIDEIAQALLDVCEGQVLDLESLNKKITYKALLKIHEEKTAALLIACVKAVALELGADRSKLVALTTYAKHLGLAFQIADDILDVESSVKTLGKPVRADKLKGFPYFLGLEKAKQTAQMEKNKAIEALKPFGQKAKQLIEMAEFVVSRKN